MKKQLTHVDLQRMCFALGGDYKTIHIANDHIHDLDNLLTENEAMVTVGTWMAPFEYERAKTFTKMFTSTGIDGGHQVIALTGACTFAYRPTHFYCISVVLPKRDVYLSELPNIYLAYLFPLVSQIQNRELLAYLRYFLGYDMSSQSKIRLGLTGRIFLYFLETKD